MPTDPSHLAARHRSVIRALQARGVRFVIIGGYAARLHGARRPTRDLDLVADLTRRNFERLALALADVDGRLRIAGMTDHEARRLTPRLDGETISRFGSSTWMTRHGPLDVLVDMPVRDGRLGFGRLASRATIIQIEGGDVRVAALEDLIAAKEHVARPKDAEALPELRRLRERRPG